MEALSGALDEPRATIFCRSRSKSVRETRLISPEMEADLMTRNGFSIGMVDPISKGWQLQPGEIRSVT